MGKATGKRRAAPVRMPSGFDATPERIAKESGDVVQGLPDPGKPIVYARQFRAPHLDRLYRAGALTWVQHYAGNWYRETHERCRFSLSIVASYGERTGAGEPPGTFGVGLPRAEAQLRARKQLAGAREQWPQAMRGFMDRLILHDAMPRYGGRAAARNLTDIRNALDILAAHLRMSTPG